MTVKTVTINVPIEVRKTGPDEYQFLCFGDDWSRPTSEATARHGAVLMGYPGSRAIVQAIDSGAFVDPLPTATGAHIYNPRSKAHFIHTDDDDTPWISSRAFNDRYWHTSEQVQSYGPFEVLYDPEALDESALTIHKDTGEWLSGGTITGEQGAVIAASALPGMTSEQVSEFYDSWLSADPEKKEG